MDITAILLRPVPDQTAARTNKSGFRQYPLKSGGMHADEPLVDINLFGLAGQSYYSRPNAATGQPIPGVDSAVLVRQSIAERLSKINFALQQSAEVEALFDGKVELYVNEGYRDLKVQQQLYEDTFPQLIRKQYPQFSQEEVLARRDRLIAEPPRPDSPSPHATGAAVDVRLRYSQPDTSFVPNSDVLLADRRADTSEAIYPDYYEHQSKLTKQGQTLRRNRRVFYWIMRGALIEDDSGFVVNPHEWWHWSYGDQLWAQLTNAPEAFFAIAPGIDTN